jgi:hypothetical protein
MIEKFLIRNTPQLPRHCSINFSYSLSYVTEKLSTSSINQQSKKHLSMPSRHVLYGVDSENTAPSHSVLEYVFRFFNSHAVSHASRFSHSFALYSFHSFSLQSSTSSFTHSFCFTYHPSQPFFAYSFHMSKPSKHI